MASSECAGHVTGPDRAARVAGALAEAGVTQLNWSSGGTTVELVARQTDLPGLLSAAEPGSIAWALGGTLRIEVGTEAIAWDAAQADPCVRHVVAELLARE